MFPAFPNLNGMNGASVYSIYFSNMNRIRELIKKLLEPYPVLFNLARRVHGWMYQRIDFLRHLVMMPIARPLYRRYYRNHWERAGSVSLKQDLGLGFLDPRGRHTKQTEFITGEIEALNPRTILEVGCGYGRLLKRLGNILPGIFLCGYDISSAKLSNARIYLGQQCPPLVQGDGRFGLPFKDNAFEIVYTCNVLVHVPPPFDMAIRRELFRVASRYIVHVESTGTGMHKFGYDNATIYRSMGCDVEEYPYPLEQSYSNPVQYIVVER